MNSRIIKISNIIRDKGFTPQWCVFVMAIAIVTNVATANIFGKIVYKLPKVDLIESINNPPKFFGDSRVIFESLKDIYIRREDIYLKYVNECTLFVEPTVTMTASSVSMRLKDGFFCNLTGKGVIRWPDISVTQDIKKEAISVKSHGYLSFIQSIFYVLWQRSKISKTSLIISSLRVLFATKIAIVTTSTIFAFVYSYKGFNRLHKSQEFKWWMVLNSVLVVWIICTIIAAMSLCILEHEIPGWRLHLTMMMICFQILFLLVALILSTSQYSYLTANNNLHDKQEFDEIEEVDPEEGENSKKSTESRVQQSSSPSSLSTGSDKDESLDPLKLVFQDISIRQTGHIAEYHSNSPKTNNRSVSAPIFLTTNSSPLSANPNELIKSSLSIKRSIKPTSGSKQRKLQEYTPLANSNSFDGSVSPRLEKGMATTREKILEENTVTTNLNEVQQDNHLVADL